MDSKALSEDTIAAIATPPPGEGGVGIVRISGPKAPEVLAKLWQGHRSPQELDTHKLYFGKFIDPSTGEELDQGLVVWMRAPHSYTAEEVVEFHAHGGPFVLNRLLQCVLDLGVRIAEPGEFTRRAYFNGQLDLLQAEAVGELIHAHSESALRNARAQLEGRLSREVGALRERVIGLLARVEAAIDFPEEDIEIIRPEETLQEVGDLGHTLETWLEKFQLGRLVREGVRLALVGRPNVGKSSLLNLLAGEEKAIVHTTPGTTRDVVEAGITLDGVSCQVFDTAGIRQGEEAVEQEGVRRSKEMAERADLTLLILDVSQKLSAEDREVFSHLTGPVLVVGNKCDLPVAMAGWKADLGQGLGEWVLLSAKTGEGLEKLKSRIQQKLGLGALADHSQAYLNNARHREALLVARDGLNRARQALEENLPTECIAADLREAGQALGTLLGEIRNEDVLDRIFAEFCLGK